MAIGPDERAKLAEQTYQQYIDKSPNIRLACLELTLRSLQLSEKNADRGLIDWDVLIQLRGQCNGVVQGILRIMDEKQEWTLQALQTWKRHHTPLWMQVQEPLHIQNKVRDYMTEAKTAITKKHVGLKALQYMIDKVPTLTESSHIKANERNIETNARDMANAGYGKEAKALCSMAGILKTPNFDWLHECKEKVEPVKAAVVDVQEATIIRETPTPKAPAAQILGMDDAEFDALTALDSSLSSHEFTAEDLAAMDGLDMDSFQ